MLSYKVLPLMPSVRAFIVPKSGRAGYTAVRFRHVYAKSRSKDEAALGLREIERLTFKLKDIKRVIDKLRDVAKGPLTVKTKWRRFNESKDVRIVDHNKIYAYSPKAEGYVQIPNIWLRDNCQCKSCVHEETKQRLLDTWQIPKDLSIKNITKVSNRMKIKSATHYQLKCIDGVKIEWSDGHQTSFSNEFLARSALENPGLIRQGVTDIHLWGSSIKNLEPIVQYLEVMDAKSSDGMREWLRKIRTYGFCYVDNTPTAEATEKLLERIAFIRLTHYGGFYDFTADLASKDTAYTSIALDAHTDNTYFNDPAGLQAFHLLSHTEGSGGESLLVDGFKCAKDLQNEDPEAYQILSTVNVHGHASGNEGISIQPWRGFPVLNHDPTTGALVQVRWNSNDRAAIELPVEDVEKWYKAAAKWVEIVRRPENEYWKQLTPGRVLVFDNWRVMHGRAAFTGKRRIAGAYINRDDWISKFKMLHFGKEEVLEAIPIGL
ncbi:Trimethyllysine dioxygenase [Delitschia confertaspora ATCC 74209]|uniref:trimethyllysine dioxygenase n=1 Tax=Delitschia confertaspora ATCC 74209 TaxID=1513339 RepID=A0A9P4MPP6_9PLEO|nr:Trimethyllysine dioxygenase [Delitschia confertaspora ATCC 74209]